MILGVMHAHSTYSDGEFTLPELRKVLLEESCSFLCITDHAEYFDSQSMKHYISECLSLSDGGFLFVPGMEYRCERNIHILGYGATEPTLSTDPQAVIRHICSQGAVPVIAHPPDYAFSWIESFEILPAGIETWNTKYDGRYAPRPETFALLRSLQRRAPELRAFYGQDLHWKNQYRGLRISIGIDSLNRERVLSALASGNFEGRKDSLKLPASGSLPDPLMREFAVLQARSKRLRAFFKKSKQTLHRLGIRVPDAIRAQVRRIY